VGSGSPGAVGQDVGTVPGLIQLTYIKVTRRKTGVLLVGLFKRLLLRNGSLAEEVNVGTVPGLCFSQRKAYQIP
jgi:hypothetical protein